ncbi:MAG: hypothetical protein LN412_04615 [Candidatus Thermoplasmatota archaeon]|nr:hypothetical protein [Candidatus Thermoplasmatota archaeon]
MRSLRGSTALIIVALGMVLMAVSFFLLGAPIGFPPSGVEHSNPRVPFAPAFFILGVIIVFLAPVLYELYPGER